MKITEKNVIGELVAADYRTAEVFAKYTVARGRLQTTRTCHTR